MQIGILKTEFKGTEGGQGYITPEKFKARLMWAHRVVASDCIRSGAGEESDSCACGSQPPSHQPSKSSGNLTSTGKKKVQGNHLPATVEIVPKTQERNCVFVLQLKELQFLYF